MTHLPSLSAKQICQLAIAPSKSAKAAPILALRQVTHLRQWPIDTFTVTFGTLSLGAAKNGGNRRWGQPEPSYRRSRPQMRAPLARLDGRHFGARFRIGRWPPFLATPSICRGRTLTLRRPDLQFDVQRPSKTARMKRAPNWTWTCRPFHERLVTELSRTLFERYSFGKPLMINAV